MSTSIRNSIFNLPEGVGIAGGQGWKIKNAEATSFLTATGITDKAQQKALDDLVTDLKAINAVQANFVNFDTPASSILKAVYPFIGSTADSHKFNLIDPQDADGSFRLVFANDHEANHTSSGYKPNGTDQYADSKYVASANVIQHDEHISLYATDEGSGSTEIDMGAYSGAGGSYFTAKYNNALYGILNSEYAGELINYPNSQAAGFYILNRTSAIYMFIMQNGLKCGIEKVNTTLYSPLSIYIGGVHHYQGNKYSTKNISFASMGSGMTEAAAYLFNAAVQKYVIALGRINYDSLLMRERDFSHITRYANNPITPKNAGAWNAYGSDTPYINIENKIGNTYYAVTQCSSTAGVWNNLALYTSTDLINWTPYASNPVLSNTLNGDDDHYLFHPCIMKIGEIYNLYYTASTNAGKAQILRATSSDMITWTKQGVCYTKPYHVQSQTVYMVGSTYYMVYLKTASGVAELEYATSTDGINWTTQKEIIPVMSGDWFAGSYLADIWVIKNSEGTYEMVFSSTTGMVSGQSIGYAKSFNGADWLVKCDKSILDKGSLTWESYSVGDAVLLEKEDGTTYLYYVGMEDAEIFVKSDGALAIV
jgi:predicted GH43/DUF377 family glycosyl hydrolase